MKSFYFTATTDDLRSLDAAAAIEMADLRCSLVSICSRIATRRNTDEARERVKPLSE